MATLQIGDRQIGFILGLGLIYLLYDRLYLAFCLALVVILFCLTTKYYNMGKLEDWRIIFCIFCLLIFLIAATITFMP